MFAVGPVLVSDALLDASFACNLSACHGACCVQGERGAPLAPEERAELEHALPVVQGRLREDALRTIAAQGVWEEDAAGTYATTTVEGRECVFVTYDGPVAKCALQQAHHEGALDFEKPISCHLYPIRVERYGEGEEAVEVLNVEHIELCRPAWPHGRRTGTQLADFLARPLARRYGEAWLRDFRQALADRRAVLEITPGTAPGPDQSAT